MWMTHPTLPDQPAEVVESAFDDFWQYRGWVVCDPPPEPDEDAPTAPAVAHDQPVQPTKRAGSSGPVKE